jgi:hypothetical protein
MHLGPDRTAASIRHVLDAGSCVVCHDTLPTATSPFVAKAEELGRDAGRSAASQVFDGNSPDEAYQWGLRGVEDGDRAVLDAAELPAIGPAAGNRSWTSG